MNRDAFFRVGFGACSLMAILFIAVAALFYSGCAAPKQGSPSYAPEQVIVRFNDGVPVTRQNDIHSALRAKVLYTIDTNLYLVEIKGEKVEDSIAAYQSYDEVDYAEPQYIHAPQQTPIVIFDGEGSGYVFTQSSLDTNNPFSGTYSGKFNPTQFGSAIIRWPSQINAGGKQVVALRVRASTTGLNPQIEFGRFGAYSRILSLNPYVKGGGGVDTSWKLVEIPQDSLNNAGNGALNGIERVRLMPITGTHSVWLDSIVARDSTSSAPPDTCPPCPQCPPETNWNPNDPSYGSQWHLHSTATDSTWKWLTRGDSTVVVAVMDSGSDTANGELANRYWRNPGEIPGDSIDNDANGFVDDRWGWDFMSGFMGDNNPEADSDTYARGHGIHVAGIIAATYNNGASGAGMDQRCKVMALKGHNMSVAWTVTATRNALLYAARNGAHVINCSFANSGFSSTVSAAIDSCRARGIVIVCAAANNGSNNDTSPIYPASYPQDNIIAVGATNQSHAKPAFSNFGLVSVDLGAPGQSIVATKIGSSTGDTTLTGTSQAAPMVSAAAALVIAQAIKKGTLPAPGPARSTYIRNQILENVDTYAALADKWATGGELNVRKACDL